MKTLFKVFVLLISISLVQSCTKEVATIDQQSDSSQHILKKGKPDKDGGCTTIQSGELFNSAGDVITTGYNDFGYNYQAHLYNGDYGYPGWKLVMKWNDAWLSNMDCDGDGLLDRHLGYDSYIGSGAWVTNHWMNTYTDEFGNECEYDEFIKIIAVPEDAELKDGYWYNADGVEIGESIWGSFAIIQYILNDPCAGVEGVQYKSPDHPGLGNW